MGNKFSSRACGGPAIRSNRYRMGPESPRPAMSSSNPASAAAVPAASAGQSSAARGASGAVPRDSLYVAWARSRQREERRRDGLLHGLHAQADPSEAAGIAGPITSWAEGHARDKRRHACALAGLKAHGAEVAMPS